ncbi:hypothetical protein [Paucisalibacillus globulus]|uniref:hypothetical protein n=1 Tax=Paucisalibacillus globulus TaxID=351095 RepID=UPI000BB76DA2|nr:hypothetical protein [Paucisalibacillus globulus]
MTLLATFIGVVIIYYFGTLSLYEPTDELHSFPVPRNAKLIENNELGARYHWSRASEENGIPFSYEIVLKSNGWVKGDREGASVIYTKGKHKIDLISTTDQLDIIKIK